MNDPAGMPQSAASSQVPIKYDTESLDEERKLNGARLVCGDADTDLTPGLNANRSETIPFFPSFFDNLGPTYQPPPKSEGLLFEMIPFGAGQALNVSDYDKTDFDSWEYKSDGDHGFTATVLPKSRNVTVMIRTDESSLRAVQNSMPEHFESEDEVTSTFAALVRTASGPAGGVLKDMLSTSIERTVCGRRIYVDAFGQNDGLQLPRTPVLSVASSSSCQRTPLQCIRKPTLSDVPGNAKELEDYRSPRVSPKRLRLEVGIQQDFTQNAPAALPSVRDDFDQIMHMIQVARCTVSAARRRCLRWSMSPALVPVSSPKDAMDRTLLKLQQWHFRLDLDNPACPTIASHIFWRAFRMFERSRWPLRLQPEAHDRLRVRVLMATAFWVAAKIVDTMHKIPKASDMAITARITPKSLIHAELPMLDALQWKLVRY